MTNIRRIVLNTVATIIYLVSALEIGGFNFKDGVLMLLYLTAAQILDIRYDICKKGGSTRNERKAEEGGRD